MRLPVIDKNKKIPDGCLTPSLISRIHNVITSVKKLCRLVVYFCLVPLVISSCSQNQLVSHSNNRGVLTLVANGEDLVRQGFVTKDGWRMDFNHVYVTLAEVVAYQTNPPFNPEQEGAMQATETLILVSEPTTVDLAAGDENAAPILVTRVDAPLGIYNALSWKVTDPNSESSTIVLEGQGTKDNQRINFEITFNTTLDYVCGEFVGDERKGIVTAQTPAEVETTFHFDHIFGNAEVSAEDNLNLDALGFQPLAALAENGNLRLDKATLSQKLSPENYGKLQKAIASLGHVGEGHCQQLKTQ